MLMSKRQPSIARLTVRGDTFEVLVDPELALEFRLGKPMGIDKILVHDVIYRDAKKGLRASEQAMQRAFGTTDVRRIAERIIKEGEIPITSEQRKRLVEEKRKQIIEWIARNCIDTRTKTPVPPQRVENALERARISVDPFKPIDEQIPGILKEVQRVIPIKVAVAVVSITATGHHAGRIRNAVGKLGKVIRESYTSDGSWTAEVEIPAGVQDVLISRINELSRGEADVKIVRVEY